MYCNKNQFPALPFCGPHPKPCGARGFSKHYPLSFDPKIGHGICAILRIQFAYVACTSMLDQPWIYGKPFKKTSAINLSQIVLNGKFLSHINIGISFNCLINQQLLRRFRIYIRLFLME